MMSLNEVGTYYPNDVSFKHAKVKSDYRIEDYRDSHLALALQNFSAL